MQADSDQIYAVIRSKEGDKCMTGLLFKNDSINQILVLIKFKLEKQN